MPTDDPYTFGPGAVDSIATISIGRIPFDRVADVDTYIDKVIAYELQGSMPWKARALHIVEDHDYEGILGSLVAIHEDSLASGYAGRESYFAKTILSSRAYYDSLGTAARAAWNAGVGFVLAHGNIGNDREWASVGIGFCPPPGIPVDVDDGLLAYDRCPVALAVTCGAGFVSAGTPGLCGSMAQWMLATPRKGCSVVVGPSRGIREQAAFLMAREWFRNAFRLDGPSQIEPGVVLQIAKATLMPRAGRYHTEILSFALLGDPALQMPIAQAVVGLPPQAVENAPIRLRPIGSPGRVVCFQFRVPQPGSYALQLYDVRGRSVGSRSSMMRTRGAIESIAFSNLRLSSGVYLGTLKGPGVSATSKFVVLP